MINLNAEQQKWVDDIWGKLDRKLSRTATEIADIVPCTTENGKYIQNEREGLVYWTNGFFGGMMWLMYQMTGKPVYKNCAARQECLMDGAFKIYDGLYHDVGFQWDLLAKPHYELEGNKASRIRTLYAANILAARVNIRGGYIRVSDKYKQISIIDTMMNLPLLYWASRELDDERFSYIAQMHADMTLRVHVRDDGSVAHEAIHDEEGDAVRFARAGQGCSPDSSWTRGQAWAIYGFILSYIHTGKQTYLDACKKISDYFLAQMKKFNFKTPTDFCQPEDVDYQDNSAGACAACGMIELYKATGEQKYLDGAIRILQGLEEDCIFDDSDQSIVQKGMVAYCRPTQVHLVYADFFLVEAISKLKNCDYLIW